LWNFIFPVYNSPSQKKTLPLSSRQLQKNQRILALMPRDPFEGMTGDELDPQAAESDQLASLGMHAVDMDAHADADEEEEESETPAAPGEEVDPSDDLDRDGLAELEQMEQQILQEDPVLDFATVEDE
jgi:hypothetical protein